MNIEKELANGMRVDYLDESKKLAGDRWLVRLRFRGFIPLQGWMKASLVGDDPQTVFCREEFGDRLVHEVIRERNFIDEGEKDALLSEMVQAFEQDIAGYLEKETFARQLFTLKLGQTTERYLRQERIAPLMSNEEDDAPGPADFSACFR